ncbi:MAG: hypothetical protein LC637_11555, partial [Xanthomonadaceae bacterium]|nr:hypothetical protein [Xanthomonadaceae bacterium]
ECGREELTKLVSAAGFRLKGGGWYETDFKKDGKRNLAGDSASDGAKSTDSGKTGADSGSTSGTNKSDSSKSDSNKSDSSKSDSKPAGKPSTGAASSAA